MKRQFEWSPIIFYGVVGLILLYIGVIYVPSMFSALSLGFGIVFTAVSARLFGIGLFNRDPKECNHG